MQQQAAALGAPLAPAAVSSPIRRATLLGSYPRLAGLPVPNKSAARHAARRPRQPAGAVRATAAPPAPQQTGGTVAWERTLPLGPGASVTVQVATGGDEQRILVVTNRPGRLLLHWGVEGGRNYKGGWRLPGDRCQPDGTINYKNRALQTPFRPAGSNGVGLQAVELRLAGDEASDYLNFVVKDEDTGTWYDLNGTNFQVALRGEPEDPVAVTLTSMDSATASAPTNGNGRAAAPARELPPLMPMDQVPQLPQELCGIWAYIKWEQAGCPNRSKEEADREYEAGIQELIALLRRGRSIDEVWRVARGELKYADYMREWGWLLAPEQRERAQATAAPAAPAKQVPSIPQELVNIQAYILWEQAGKPDGADFGDRARQALEQRLRSGSTIADIEREFRAPQPPPQQQQQQQAPPAAKPAAKAAPAKAAPAAPASPPPPPAQPVVGQSMGMRQRNPLDLIRRSDGSGALLSSKPKYLRTPLTSLLEQAQAEKDAGRLAWFRLYDLGEKRELLVTAQLEDPSNPDSTVTVDMTTTLPEGAVLHWGVRQAGRGSDWLQPPLKLLTPTTTLPMGGKSAETPFLSCKDSECYVDWNSVDFDPVDFDGDNNPLQRISLTLPHGHGLAAIPFVIRSEDGNQWWRDGGSDFTVPVPGARTKREKDKALGFEDELSRIIVDSEVNTGAWTLMHRFNKATDLLGDVMQGRFKDVEGSLVRIYVWLRYSAVRQLTWQRNYNTQPRILGAAQERLTHAITDVYDRTNGSAQQWARAMLTTVGRGGNAQAVRDEILNIMHRNKIKEVKGTWMEEWHQKLHNNTTPDDIHICEAYLAFLRSNGNNSEYWRVLTEAGVTRQMLESLDRPVRCEPEWFADKKEALINDFENYLRILKACHSSADLQASAAAASSFVPASAKGYLGYVLAHSNGPEILPIMEAAVEARAELLPVLRSSRDVLYLDLALEAVVRAAAERGAGHAGLGAASFVAPLLLNLALSLGDNEEVCYCLKAWQELPQNVRSGDSNLSQDDALRAIAVVERIRRALASVSDYYSHTVEPISTQFGHSFGCESWAVKLFPEEVVRGGPAFAVSLVLTSIEPRLRAAAELGAWQIISPNAAFGRLEIVPDLHSIQEKVYEEPTVLLARHVSGEEEVPVGAVGLISGDTCDVLSHLSVRARNMHVLFATCFDPKQLEEIGDLAGKEVAFETTAAGGVNWRVVDHAEVASHAKGESSNGARRKPLKVDIPRWSGKWAVGMDGFANGVVGAKSKNLAGLRGKLPSWINLPSSVTVPFSTFEEVLKRRENKQIVSDLAAAVKAVEPSNAGSALARCRDIAMRVTVPGELQAALKDSMQAAGIPLPHSEEAWQHSLHALKSVWASKYNDRAYVSTRKVGLSFDDVRMAVLCQRIVPAQYAYVIHTTNPTNGDAGEIYCELVRGLGETIVSGTVPGAALTFVARKDDIENPKVLLYPSKGEGMFVPESLIFRSDSNGEDLEGYAGAGLYDSVTTASTERRKVDYSSDPLMTDPGFRHRLMVEVCKAGLAIEQALGSAQDVEGVVDADGTLTVVQTRPQM
ncbi:alpha-glucan water chloroplastic [Chlorella sorokiniana]|uniref:Alpha-glucan water chloroplastic n=1 Tax=Chlorella sorokiniana TaxID=3076 RepID=A0A2P6TG32_CHLSO|nr:alpha-glucan water chloroplastic [Chlorella sorokiniana]|eukprot:PRW33076.1 alpha-glucan water chloroplastic [Chlorella sorokiniana]